MTGFDETVPPDDDPSADPNDEQADRQVGPDAAPGPKPAGGPEFIDVDDERPPRGQHGPGDAGGERT